MGFCPDSTPEMGEFTVETRRESFFIRGPMDAYESDGGQGATEILYSDIPKIRAALDLVEKHKR
jgi:hypothetical protein